MGLESQTRKAIEAVLFDADGTLFDSGDAVYFLVRDLFSEKGWPMKDRDSIVSLIGKTNKEIAEILVPQEFRRDEQAFKEWATEAERRWIEYYLPKYVRTMDNAREVLETLRGMGFKLGMVSNGSAKEIPLYLRGGDLEGYFSAVITADHVKRPKPFPDPLFKATSQLGVAPDRAMYVGDTILDALSARAAGMFLALILSGIGRREDLINEKPDILIESIKDLPEAIVSFVGSC